MKIIRRLLYAFFILLLFIAFVFFGGGRLLIGVGKTLECWEVMMKEHFGTFCQSELKGQRRIDTRQRRVAPAKPVKK